eukprot:UN34003
MQREFQYNCVDCFCRLTTQTPTKEPTAAPTVNGRTCDVRLYDFANFDGWEVTFTIGSYDVHDLVNIDSSLNNDAAAVSVRTHNCYVTLFDDEEFTGKNVTLPFGEWSSIYGYFDRDSI